MKTDELWCLIHSMYPNGIPEPESVPTAERLPRSQTWTYLHGFNQVMQWLENSGPSGRQKFIARKLSDLLVDGRDPMKLEYNRGQLDAINEWVRKNQTQEER